MSKGTCGCTLVRIERRCARTLSATQDALELRLFQFLEMFTIRDIELDIRRLEIRRNKTRTIAKCRRDILVIEEFDTFELLPVHQETLIVVTKERIINLFSKIIAKIPTFVVVAIISVGSFTLSGIGLASLVGVILNLILPEDKKAAAEK